MLDVPPWLRLLLAIGITVARSVLFVHLFHPHMLRLTAPPAKKGDDPEADPPRSVKDLSGRLTALATFAFVFLLGFGFSQFWNTAKDAREAVLSEATDYRRAVSLAEYLPPAQGEPILSALEIDRTNALPSPMAVAIIGLVVVLGLTNLIAIAVFQPAPKKANLVVIATMAALTGFLLFVLVEISNPYTGAGAIT